MSELYKQRLIDIYGEDIVIKFLKSNSTEEIYEMFYGSLLSDSYMEESKFDSMVAFENYAIKYVDSEKDEEIRNKINSVIELLYKKVMLSNIKSNEELANVSNLFRSKLLRSEQIKKMATPEQALDITKSKMTLARQSKQIAAKFQKYFELKIQQGNEPENSQQLEDLKKLELSEDEKKELINFFLITKNNYKEENKWIEDIKEKYFVSLLTDPDNKTKNIHEQEFIANYAVEHFYVLEGLDKAEIGLIANQDLSELGHATSDHLIMLNMAKIYTNLGIVQTACHEKQHLVQSNNLHNGKFNKTSYYYLLDEITRSFPQDGNTGNEEYHNNYQYEEIELDAEEVSHDKLKIYLLNLFQKYGINPEKAQYRIEKMIESHQKSRYKPSATKILNGENVPQFKYNVSRLKQIVEEHPEVLKKYSMLELIFDNDGKMKDINEIISGTSDFRHYAMVDDVILNEVLENGFTNIKVANMNESQREKANNNLGHALKRVLDNNGICVRDGLKGEAKTMAVVNINLLSRFIKYGKDNMEIFEGNYDALRILVKNIGELNVGSNNPYQKIYAGFAKQILDICEEHERSFAVDKKISTNMLGKQVMGEMNDVTYTDETEKQEQIDIGHMQNRETQEK